MARLLSIVVLLIAMISIQFGASLAKQLFPLIGAGATTMLRTSLAAISLWLIWRPWRHPFPSLHKWTILGYGASLGVMNLTFYYAVQRIPLGIAVALEFTGPLAVALFGSRKAIDVIWAVLASIGLYLILPVQTDQSLDPVGIAFALIAGASWAFYIIFGKRVGSKFHGGQGAALGLGIASLVALPFGIAEATPSLFDGDVWLMGALIALMSSALPYSLEMIALRRLPMKTFGILMSLEPLVAAVMGLIFLDENLSHRQWGAMIAIMAASVGSTLSPR